MIRPERTFERYSRGLEVVRAIQALWDRHNAAPGLPNTEKNAGIKALLDEFDLTVTEWHHWCRLASHMNHYDNHRRVT